MLWAWCVMVSSIEKWGGEWWFGGFKAVRRVVFVKVAVERIIDAPLMRMVSCAGKGEERGRRRTSSLGGLGRLLGS
jgi:hypothetical protein